MRHGAEVYAVMTSSAEKLISPQLMEWATGNPVVMELTGRIEHVELGGAFEGSADLLLIAPATANTIGKIAAGIDDTPVTSLATTSIGSGLPIVLVPAMHRSMYDHPVVQQNMKKLESLGIRIVQPEVVEGKAKIADVNAIVEEVILPFGQEGPPAHPRLGNGRPHPVLHGRRKVPNQLQLREDGLRLRQ